MYFLFSIVQFFFVSRWFTFLYSFQRHQVSSVQYNLMSSQLGFANLPFWNSKLFDFECLSFSERTIKSSTKYPLIFCSFNSDAFDDLMRLERMKSISDFIFESLIISQHPSSCWMVRRMKSNWLLCCDLQRADCDCVNSRSSSFVAGCFGSLLGFYSLYHRFHRKRWYCFH